MSCTQLSAKCKSRRVCHGVHTWKKQADNKQVHLAIGRQDECLALNITVTCEVKPGVPRKRMDNFFAFDASGDNEKVPLTS